MTPKNYPFYRFDEHARIIDELERQAPAAIVAATGKNPGVAGALYPFPFIEDADFDIPSAYMRDGDGEILLGEVGERVQLKNGSQRLAAIGDQVVAVKPGRSVRRIVLAAHIDAKKGTPGALDNAAGVACTLEAAALLAERDLGYSLEIAPFNGEDNYAAPGEVAYIAANHDRFGDVELAINVDAAGYGEGVSAVSLYECPERVERVVRELLADSTRIAEGLQWPQSDHMVFAMRGVPAIAVTSSEFEYLCTEITHTEKDVPELVDADLLAQTARFLADVVVRVDEQLE
jgi:aminopeptidase YwaD